MCMVGSRTWIVGLVVGGLVMGMPIVMYLVSIFGKDPPLPHLPESMEGVIVDTKMVFTTLRGYQTCNVVALYLFSGSGSLSYRSVHAGGGVTRIT